MTQPGGTSDPELMTIPACREGQWGVWLTGVGVDLWLPAVQAHALAGAIVLAAEVAEGKHPSQRIRGVQL